MAEVTPAMAMSMARHYRQARGPLHGALRRLLSTWAQPLSAHMSVALLVGWKNNSRSSRPPNTAIVTSKAPDACAGALETGVATVWLWDGRDALGT